MWLCRRFFFAASSRALRCSPARPRGPQRAARPSSRPQMGAATSPARSRSLAVASRSRPRRPCRSHPPRWTGTNQSVRDTTVGDDTYVVNDARGTSLGWNVTATASQFTCTAAPCTIGTDKLPTSAFSTNGSTALASDPTVPSVACTVDRLHAGSGSFDGSDLLSRRAHRHSQDLSGKGRVPEWARTRSATLSGGSQLPRTPFRHVSLDRDAGDKHRPPNEIQRRASQRSAGRAANT